MLGGDHVVVRFGQDEESIVAYLPIEAASHLPLEESFTVRAVVSVHPRQDPEEANACALRVHAIARVHDADSSS